MNSKLSIDNVRSQIVGVEAKVPLLDGTQTTYINFDNASTTPALRPVLNKVEQFLYWYGSIGRGAGLKSQLSTDVLVQARETVLSFVAAHPEAHTVVFGTNTTDVLNKLACRLPFSKGDIVLCSLMEHHSNDLPWRHVAEVKYIGVCSDGSLNEDHLERLLSKHAGQIRLVVITGGSNVTGYINRIYDIAEKAHAIGARILVDAAQLASHRRIEMGSPETLRSIDFVAFSAHKMYAPFGTGVLVGLKEVFLQGEPASVGGGTVDLVTTQDVRWAAPPAKEEAGSPNVAGIVALAKAIQCLEEIDLEAIARHEAHLTSRLLSGVQEIDGIRIHGDGNPSHAFERLGVVAIEVDGMAHQLVSAILAAERGIAVRSGMFCAHPYMLNLLSYPDDGVAALEWELEHGIRAHLPGFTRVSFGMYNTKTEVDALIDVLDRIVHKGYVGQYVQEEDTGRFRAKGFNPQLNEFFDLRK